MSVEITASEGGIPHNKLMISCLIVSIICLYLTYVNTYTTGAYLSFFGGLAAVSALVWGSDTIKHLCSYGLGTGVPSAGMMAFGSGVIAFLIATKFGVYAPIVAIIVAAVVGAILGFCANKITNMNIPVMEISLTELCIVGAVTMMGLVAMLCGSFDFTALVQGSATFFGLEFVDYGVSVIGACVLAAIFMLGGIALQHPFNACLGPNESQDRTLMLTAECGFLSMIPVAVISYVFIDFVSATLALIISVLGWLYTFVKYLELSKRDAYAWLDAKQIREVGGE